MYHTNLGAGLVSGYFLGLDPFGISPPALHDAAGFSMKNSANIDLVVGSLLFYFYILQRRAQQQQVKSLLNWSEKPTIL
ncbi:MAG: hypothetical protein H7240_09380 [Glaciimonas sp.]|nr:hypothetical protein [Glaciimonas sp.]